MREARVWGTRSIASPLLLCLVLGLALRLVRYALHSPLWWNEAFLAVNFLRRGWRELLLGLDYHQVCPAGFLWLEKAAVSLAGFHEWSLRAIPLMGGLASLPALALLARQGLSRRGEWLAVLLLAVSYHPIRLASEVKPYATDAFVAAALLALAAHALNRPEGRSRIWLAVLAPLFLVVSYPAAFVLAGAVAVLCVSQWNEPARWRVRVELAALVLSAALSFLAVYAIALPGQARSADAADMAGFWAEGLPALASLPAFVGWLATTHTGTLLAVPAGSGPGAGLPGLVLCLVGVAGLWRHGRRRFVWLCLAPFAFTLIAAMLGRYPYGARARVIQHLVPSICCLMAAGIDELAARVAARFGSRVRFRLVRLTVVALVLVGTIPLVPDIRRPYRTTREHEAREFARRFWPAYDGSPPTCLRWDLNVLPWDSSNPDVALYLCNQAIYSLARRALPGPTGKAVRPSSTGEPARFVCFDSPDVPEEGVAAWLDAMTAHLGPVETTELLVAGHGSRAGRVRVFAFSGPARSEDRPVALQSTADPFKREATHVGQVVTVVGGGAEDAGREPDRDAP